MSIYKDNISNDEQFYMFVDEVQFDKDWTHYLKMAYDMNPEMRAVATGSASAVVEDSARESGAGRWTVIKIPTLSFYEYCEIKGIRKNVGCENVFGIHMLSRQEQTRIIMGLSDLQIHMMRYLQLGGFPELANTDDPSYAQALIREDVMDRAIKHDLPQIYEIRSAVVLDADIYTKKEELGYALETTVFKHVKDYFNTKNKLYEVGYIRDGNGAEIDVAVQYSGQPIQLIEAKIRNNTTIKDDDGIVLYGMKDTPGYVISKSETDFGLVERKNTSLYRIPAFAFLYLMGKQQNQQI